MKNPKRLESRSLTAKSMLTGIKKTFDKDDKEGEPFV
jgi:hypothetical protein